MQLAPSQWLVPHRTDTCDSEADGTWTRPWKGTLDTMLLCWNISLLFSSKWSTGSSFIWFKATIFPVLFIILKHKVVSPLGRGIHCCGGIILWSINVHPLYSMLLCDPLVLGSHNNVVFVDSLENVQTESKNSPLRSKAYVFYVQNLANKGTQGPKVLDDSLGVLLLLSLVPCPGCEVTRKGERRKGWEGDRKWANGVGSGV